MKQHLKKVDELDHPLTTPGTKEHKIGTKQKVSVPIGKEENPWKSLQFMWQW